MTFTRKGDTEFMKFKRTMAKFSEKKNNHRHDTAAGTDPKKTDPKKTGRKS